MAARALAASAVAVLMAPLKSPPATAAPVRGKIQAQRPEATTERLGYTRTQVAAPSERAAGQIADTALFLKVEESLPIPQPTEVNAIEVAGLRLVPNVATCAVDSAVRFVNSQKTEVTLKIGDDEIPLAPGASHDHECTAGNPQRTIRVKEWPHIRGLLYVGEVGVAGRPDARGSFNLIAPDGKYELLFIGRDGVLASRPVRIKGGSVDVGTVALDAGKDAKDGTESP